MLILADDLGYGDLSCYGQETLRTPHLDRMAREGMRFTQHYAGSTVCAPSRCVLLTGKHTGHARIRGNGPSRLLDEDVTIAHRLKSAGYVTGCVGKWGVGNPPPLNDPKRMGFDYFYGYVNMYHAHNFYPEFVIRNGTRVQLRNRVAEKWKPFLDLADPRHGRGVAIKRLDYVPDLVADEAVQFIERNQERPFFLYFAMNVPHANNEAGRQGMEVPDQYEFDQKDWPEPEQGFAAMIRNIDRDVNRVLVTLQKLGLDENTLVIFTSDNGPHKEGGHSATFFNSSGAVRGTKRDVYEGGVRVPFIARWPGTIPAGTTSDHISAFQDVLPTLCELAKVDPPQDIDGISMIPTFTGHADDQTQHPYLYWEFFEQGGKQAVRQGDWKAVRLNTLRNPNGPLELYNLKDDLKERNNIAADHPEIVQTMEKIMIEAHREPAE
ncbi:arylsulfatase [Thalassoroseus pseudoceratinae]|uniref:arylsulfatase n=1 Tax=Thalassoroseus pseudoceratinae TaxID=2713176 RepID=UPI001F0F1122|nr:arylsulfatase [Thalassoroseus pseudoceratinae]